MDNDEVIIKKLFKNGSKIYSKLKLLNFLTTITYIKKQVAKLRLAT